MDEAKVTIVDPPMIPAMGEHTRILIAMFKDIGDRTISYAEATRACGREITPATAYTAIKRVLTDYNIIIKCQPGVGFRRSDGPEALEDRKKQVGFARRKSRRELKKLSVIDMSKLSHNEQIEAVITASIQQVIHHMGKPSSGRMLTAAAANAEKTEVLSLGNTLKLFADSGNA